MCFFVLFLTFHFFVLSPQHLSSIFHILFTAWTINQNVNITTSIYIFIFIGWQSMQTTTTTPTEQTHTLQNASVQHENKYYALEKQRKKRAIIKLLVIPFFCVCVDISVNETEHDTHWLDTEHNWPISS